MGRGKITTMKRARKKETRGNKNPQYLKKSKEGDDDKHSISLPVDLIIEILTRLRPRSLSKLICVSKLWSSIIQGKYFTNLYLTRSSTRPLLLFHSYSYQTRLSRYSSPSSLHSITLPGYQTHLSPPVRGLICCADDDSNAVIGNPSTGQFFTLPSVYDLSLKGIFLGYEPVHDLYKVLSMNVVIARPGASIVGERCQVLTLGAQESWRTIDCEYYFYPLTQGICLNGVVYHGAHSSSPGEENCCSVIMSFDLRFEEFSLITLPEGVHILRCRSNLVIYNGNIAFVIHSPNGKFDLWHLIDVNKQEWTKVSVVVPCWRDLFGDDDLRGFCGNLIRCMGTINTGELIFAKCYSQKHHSFLCYDPKEHKSRMVYIPRNGDSYYHMNIFLNHVESPMFLPTSDD